MYRDPGRHTACVSKVSIRRYRIDPIVGRVIEELTFVAAIVRTVAVRVPAWEIIPLARLGGYAAPPPPPGRQNEKNPEDDTREEENAHPPRTRDADHSLSAESLTLR